MEEISSYLKRQYELVQGSRQVLLDYCGTMKGKDLLDQNSSFGRGGSVRNLLVHIANTYEFWILGQALKETVSYTEFTDIGTLEEIRKLFASVDASVLTFLDRFEGAYFEPLEIDLNGGGRNIPPFELFTHVITHEFHHKGQILSLSRHLGYQPIDTDIVR